MDQNTNKWPLANKMAFRFFAAYLITYLVSLLAGIVLQPFVSLAGKLLHVPEALWSASHNGSGDSTYHYLQLLCTLLVSTIVFFIWSIFDRKRSNYDNFLYWLQVVIRYVLAFYMIIYGTSKVFMLQFRAPSLFHLVQPYGYSSPMGLAWRFMGYSYGFNVFTGLAEALGGFLLFFRPAKTFGALFCMTVLTNVVAMNFCYDIPVKIFSSHLLLMAVFIAASDIKRLVTFFFTNKPLAAQALNPVFPKDVNVVKGILKLVIGVVLFIYLVFQYENYKKRQQKDQLKPALYGIYDVTGFERNNTPVPLLITDSLLWRQLIFDKNYSSVRTMNDKRLMYEAVIDTHAKTIKLTAEDSGHIQLTYTRPDTTRLLLHGILTGDTVTISLKKRNLKDFQLINRGFHWINEAPYNR